MSTLQKSKHPFLPGIKEINGKKFIINENEKVYNVLKIHNNEKSDIFNVDEKQKNISIAYPCNNNNSKLINKKLNKAINFDDILVESQLCTGILTRCINRLLDGENCVFVTVNRGVRNKSKYTNEQIFEELLKTLFKELNGDESESRKCSLRFSATEIWEDEDKIIDLCQEINQNDSVTNAKHQFYRFRINDLENARNLIRNLRTVETFKSRNHRLYTIHLYQQVKSVDALVSIKHSTLNYLQLDVTKTKMKASCMSLSSISRYMSSTINKNQTYAYSLLHNQLKNSYSFYHLLNSVFFDYSNFYCFLTHISLKEKNVHDTYQLLQFSGKIQRLKVKLRTYMIPIETDGENNQTKQNSNTSSTRWKCLKEKQGKLSDSEVASLSEMSCMETVVMVGEPRGCSDDESHISRKLRASFISDSDSGCKDVRRKCFNRFQNHKGNPKNNSFIWTKAALKKAKDAMINGKETWVDGPSVSDIIEAKNDIRNVPAASNNYEEINLTEMVQANSRELIEYSEENDGTLRSNAFSKIRSTNDKEGDVEKLSQWINDVEMLTSPVSSLYNSLTPELCTDDQNCFMLPFCNDIVPGSSLPRYPNKNTHHQYLYYDPDNGISSLDYSSYPRSYQSQLQPASVDSYAVCGTATTHNTHPYAVPTAPVLRSQLQPVHLYHNQISYTSPVNDISSSLISTPSKSTKIKTNSKSKSFLSRSPLDLIKRTLLKTKACSGSRKKSESFNSLNLTVLGSNDLKDKSLNNELRYLIPPTISNSIEDDDEEEEEEDDDEEDEDIDNSSESSSESECNEWFRNVKTFKTKNDSPTTMGISTAKYVAGTSAVGALRPPSAPLPTAANTKQPFPTLLPKRPYSTRQRSNSSGYGSGNTKDSEVSLDSVNSSDYSIFPVGTSRFKHSVSLYQALHNPSSHEHLDPDSIAEQCENLVKQEKAFLLIKNQELMIQEFNRVTRPLISQDHLKHKIEVSTLDKQRLHTDPYYLDELEEDTNIIRDSIAFYKSLVQFESSFLSASSPLRTKKNIG